MLEASTFDKEIVTDGAGVPLAIREIPPGLVPPTTYTDERRRLGDVIVALGFADRETVEQAGRDAREQRRWIGEVLVEGGTLSSPQLAHALADRNGIDFVDLNAFQVDNGAVNLISAGEARRFQALPIAFLDRDTILVATSNPANVLGLDDVAMTTGYKVRRAVASPEEIEAVMGRLSSLEESVQEVDEETREGNFGAEVIELRESAEEAPVVKLVHSVIADAVTRGASDIHFDPQSGDMRVRFRIDGVVVDSATVPRGSLRGSSPGSRSWPSWTSPSAVHRRTAASASTSAATSSTSGSRPCRSPPESPW